MTSPTAGTVDRSPSGYDLAALTPEERTRFAAGLSAEERRVLLNQGTEPPFCGTLLDNKAAGLYACRLCGLPLFGNHVEDPDHTASVGHHQRDAAAQGAGADHRDRA